MEASRNMSNGPEAMKANKLRKSATSHSRGTKQARGEKGNARSKTKGAKFQTTKSSGKESLDAMEF
jgi:hypothetical protein